MLVRERCWIHPAREAAARCPSCERFFCRECVTEHDGRLICADCLRALRTAATLRPGSAQRARRALAAAGRTFSLALSLLVAWFFFHLLAQTLVSLPGEFHASTLWQQLGVSTGDDD